MNIMDIIELAKQGYKPGEIKELLNMQIPEPLPGDGEQKTGDDEPLKVEPEGQKNGIANSTNINKDETQATNNDNIEALKSEIASLKASLKEAQEKNTSKDETQATNNDNIEALKSEIASLKASLKEAQEKNTSRDVSGDANAQETKDTQSINNWARSFM